MHPSLTNVSDARQCRGVAHTKSLRGPAASAAKRSVLAPVACTRLHLHRTANLIIIDAIMLALRRHLGFNRQLLLAAAGLPPLTGAGGSLQDALQQHWLGSGSRGAYGGPRRQPTPQVPSVAEAEAAAEEDAGGFVTMPASLEEIGALNPQLREVMLQHQTLQK